MTSFLHAMEARFGDLCVLQSIGKSVEGRDLWVMEISDNPGTHEELEPEFKLIGNMHGNEVKGRVVALAMIQHLLENYGKDETITDVVDNHRIFIMPSMNPDGAEKAYNAVFDDNGNKKKAQLDVFGRNNAQDVDLNRNFPDQFAPSRKPLATETKLMMDWMA